MSESINLARLKKGADTFEIVVNPDAAMKCRRDPACDVRDALQAQQIFTDAKKGMLAPEQKLVSVFGSSDPLVVAKEIITKGDIQVTAEYRAAQREQKRKRIIDILQKQGVDPRTNTPHPMNRVEAALDQSKVKIDEFLPAEQQVKDILRSIQPILPIKLVTKEIALTIPPQHAGKAVSVVKSFGKLIKEAWQNDGSWHATVQIPGGLESEFYDKLNGITHGTLQAEVVRTTGEEV